MNKTELSGYIVALFLHDVISGEERDKLLRRIWEEEAEGDEGK